MLRIEEVVSKFVLDQGQEALEFPSNYSNYQVISGPGRAALAPCLHSSGHMCGTFSMKNIATHKLYMFGHLSGRPPTHYWYYTQVVPTDSHSF